MKDYRNTVLIYVKEEAKVYGMSEILARYAYAVRTDMDNVAVPVDHDIAVVTVLDLQDIAGNRVSCHRLYEVQSGLLELHRIFSSVLRHKEIK